MRSTISFLATVAAVAAMPQSYGAPPPYGTNSTTSSSNVLPTSSLPSYPVSTSSSSVTISSQYPTSSQGYPPHPTGGYTVSSSSLTSSAQNGTSSTPISHSHTQPHGYPTGYPHHNTTATVTKSGSPVTNTKTSYITGTTISVITETSTFPVTQTITTYVPCSTPVYVTSGTTHYSTSLTTSQITTTYLTTQTATITAYPSPPAHGSYPGGSVKPGSGSYPGGPGNGSPAECNCPARSYITVTETVYSSAGSAPPAPTYPAGPVTTETVTATMGNGQTTCIVITHTAPPAGPMKGGLPPYPHTSGHGQGPKPYPTGGAPNGPKPYPSGTAPIPKPYPGSSTSSSIVTPPSYTTAS